MTTLEECFFERNSDSTFATAGQAREPQCGTFLLHQSGAI